MRACNTIATVGLSQRVTAALGAARLLAAVVGSGIMGERLAGGNVAVPLLANTPATGAALVALMTCLVHRLPVVCEPGCDTRAVRDRYRCRHPSWRRAAIIMTQLLGAATATALFRWLAPTPAEVRPRRGRA